MSSSLPPSRAIVRTDSRLTWLLFKGPPARQNPRRGFAFFSATVAMLLFALPCSAQVWPVNSILDLKTDEVVLEDSAGKPIATVERTSIENVDNVTSTLAGNYGLRIPRTFIVKELSPNAFVMLDHGEPILCVNTAMLSVVGNDPWGLCFPSLALAHVTD